MRRVIGQSSRGYTATALAAGLSASAAPHMLIIHSLDGQSLSSHHPLRTQARNHSSSPTPGENGSTVPSPPAQVKPQIPMPTIPAALDPTKNGPDATGATGGEPPAPPPIPPPSQPPNGKGNNNSDGKKDSASASPASKKPISIATPIPKGFERFYQREFMSHLPTSATDDANMAQEKAVQLTAQEAKILDTQRNLSIYHRRIRRITVLMTLLGCVIGYKTYRSYTLMSTNPDLSDLHSVFISKTGHVATFYDDKHKPRAMQYFIDARTFHDEMSDSKTVLVGVPVYFPTLPLLLLCLLPVMAMMSGSFNASARAAAKFQQGAGGGGGAGVGGAMDKANRFKFKKEVGVATRLQDVAGLTEAKHEVTEVIDFLRNPARYQKLGAKLPKGVLLDGPPGVGKTLLAKAVAGEAMVNFVSCSGSEFEEVYVGVGAQRVRELFKQARAARPCVVFIDEIDAFGRKRKSDRGGNSRSTLNAFLSELDGFHDASGIIVLAATNRADVLDGALTRSGRFDRKITIDKPPHKDRVAISLVHLKPLKLDPAVTIEGFAETLASLTPGCSGADIFNICNEAAIIASREDLDHVNLKCCHKAIDRVLVGMEKKATKLSEHEKARLAYHEAGHAVLNWFLPLPDPVTKVSIAPRGTHIGLTQKLPHDIFIKTQDRLRQTMVGKLGGFVSEEYFFHDLSSNAAEDLQRVTDDAKAEICVYGMDPTIGNFGFEMDSSDAIQKPFGPKKEDAIDVAVAKVVESCANRARALLREHITHVHVIAATLLKQETLTAQEIYVLLGERPEMSAEFRKYLES